MNSEGLNRREFLKKTVAAGAVAMTSEAGQSKEKQTLKEEIKDLQEQIKDIKGRLDTFKGIDNPTLKKNVGKVVLPELKRRVEVVKESAMAVSAEAALSEEGTERLKETGNLYGVLQTIEKEIEALFNQE